MHNNFRFFTNLSETSEQQRFSVTQQDREMQSTAEDAEGAEEDRKFMSALTLRPRRTLRLNQNLGRRLESKLPDPPRTFALPADP